MGGKDKDRCRILDAGYWMLDTGYWMLDKFRIKETPYYTYTLSVTWFAISTFIYLCSMHIKTARYIISSPGYEKCPVPDKPEYAFIGRSNVGKSSLINMLCNNDKLAKTSGSPGKTQLINHFEIISSIDESDGKKKINTYTWYLVDLPGYGFAKVSIRSRNRWEQMIEHYLRKRENLAMVFVLIDARHTPQKIDLDFLDQLRKWQVPFSLVFTKSDKVNQRTVSKNVKDFLETMKKTWQFLPQHFISSALKKTGKDKILSLIEETNSGYHADN
jgi:GTP-binding protein